MRNKLICTIAVLVFPALAFATEYRTVERPRQECWNEQVRAQSSGDNYGGAIVGGIAGGLLGNQVGGGNGRTVATAVGAMTGAMVGDRMTSSNGAKFTTVRRCRTVVDRVQVRVYEEPEIRVFEQRPQYVEQRAYYFDRRNERDYRWQDNRNRDWRARAHEHEHNSKHRRRHDKEHEREDDEDDED